MNLLLATKNTTEFIERESQPQLIRLLLTNPHTLSNKILDLYTDTLKIFQIK